LSGAIEPKTITTTKNEITTSQSDQKKGSLTFSLTLSENERAPSSTEVEEGDSLIDWFIEPMKADYLLFDLLCVWI
jgi:hypothetical protein